MPIKYQITLDANLKCYRLYAQTDGSFYRDLGTLVRDDNKLALERLALHAEAYNLGTVKWARVY
jgi:hypothetical protein